MQGSQLSGWQAILSLSITCLRDLMFLVSFRIYKMLPGAVRANARGKELVALCLFVYLEHLRKWFWGIFLGAWHTSFHRGLSKCGRKHITYWDADLVPSPAEQSPYPVLWSSLPPLLYACQYCKWGCVLPFKQMDAQGVDLSQAASSGAMFPYSVIYSNGSRFIG